MEEPLPGILCDIENVVGRDLALRIAEARGGETGVSFPTLSFLSSSAAESNWLVRAVGIDAARTIVAEIFPTRAWAERISIPSGAKFRRHKTIHEVARLSKLGWGANRIARELGVSTRTIWRYRHALRREQSVVNANLSAANCALADPLDPASAQPNPSLGRKWAHERPSPRP